MPKVPEIKPFKNSASSQIIICWKPATSKSDKRHDLAELGEYMDYRIERAKKKKRL